MRTTTLIFNEITYNFVFFSHTFSIIRPMMHISLYTPTNTLLSYTPRPMESCTRHANMESEFRQSFSDDLRMRDCVKFMHGVLHTSLPWRACKGSQERRHQHGVPLRLQHVTGCFACEQPGHAAGKETDGKSCGHPPTCAWYPNATSSLFASINGACLHGSLRPVIVSSAGQPCWCRNDVIIHVTISLCAEEITQLTFVQ